MALTLNKVVRQPGGVSPAVLVSGTVSNEPVHIVHGEYTVAGGAGGTVTAANVNLVGFDFFVTADAGTLAGSTWTSSNTNGTYGFTAGGTPAAI